MDLAWQCGYPHFRPMFRDFGFTVEDFHEVVAFASCMPLNERRADLRAAMTCLITARSAGIKGVKLSDFIHDYGNPPATEAEQDQDEMNRQMAKVVGLFDSGVEVSGE